MARIAQPILNPVQQETQRTWLRAQLVLHPQQTAKQLQEQWELEYPTWPRMTASTFASKVARARKRLGKVSREQLTESAKMVLDLFQSRMLKVRDGEVSLVDAARLVLAANREIAELAGYKRHEVHVTGAASDNAAALMAAVQAGDEEQEPEPDAK